MTRSFDTTGFNLKSLLTFAAIALLFVSNIAAQQTPVVPVSELVSRAAAQRLIYLEEFKNLISKETKTFEIFDKKGMVKNRKTVTSVFIVFQASKSKDVVEFRNIISIDGREIANTDKRAEQFFDQIASSETSQKELQKLRDESQRYDEEVFIDGLTLFQAVPLAENLRPSFDFSQIGTEKIDGRETIILAYEQKRASPFIVTDSSTKPPGDTFTLQYDVGGAGMVNPRLKGKLWLDAETMRVRKELRQLTVQPEKFSAPVVYMEDEFYYASGDALLDPPTKIIHMQNKIQKKEQSVVREARVTFDYEKFTRPDVEVNSGEVKQ